MILDEIVEAKRVRLPEHKKRIDGITMRRLAEETKTRNADCFYRNLKKPGISIIGEFKMASPSLGNITSRIDLMERIEEYNASVDAISCLQASFVAQTVGDCGTSSMYRLRCLRSRYRLRCLEETLLLSAANTLPVILHVVLHFIPSVI